MKTTVIPSGKRRPREAARPPEGRPRQRKPLPFTAMIASIRTKMLVLLGATVGITLIAFSVSIYLVMTTHLVERQKNILVQLAEERKRDLVYLFADRKKIFELLALGDPVEVFARKYQEGVLVEHFRQHSEVFPVLSFSDFLGREALRIDRGRLDDKTRDLSVYDAFRKAVDRPGTVSHETIKRGTAGNPYFQLFFARRSYFDEDLGVIGAEMPLGVLTGRMGVLGRNRSGFLALLDSEGNLLFRSDKEEGTPHRGRGESGDPPLLGRTPAPPAGIARRHVDGTDSLVAQAHIPELDVTVAVVQPYSEVLSGLRQFNIVSIALSLVIVALGTNMALAVANNLIKPLKSLREATEAMAGGDTLRTAEVTTRDEIGMLAESFNRMGQSLHKSYEDLERQNTELVKLDHMKDALISDVSHELKTPVAKQMMQLELTPLVDLQTL